MAVTSPEKDESKAEIWSKAARGRFAARFTSVEIAIGAVIGGIVGSARLAGMGYGIEGAIAGGVVGGLFGPLGGIFLGKQAIMVAERISSNPDDVVGSRRWLSLGIMLLASTAIVAIIGVLGGMFGGQIITCWHTEGCVSTAY